MIDYPKLIARLRQGVERGNEENAEEVMDIAAGRLEALLGLIDSIMVGRNIVIEQCAKVADAHRGAAERSRKAKGFRASEEIRSEERGENIAAEMIAAAIRALKQEPKT